MNKANKQDLPPGLWIVATPIGNLGDLTFRAREALERADGILCEDTRETAKLLSALGIGKPESGLTRMDAHSTEKSLERIVERLLAGECLALVTDAGTPAISDPGSWLVSKARAAGIRITPIPGASALMALLSVCGFAETAFVFRGFFPRKSAEREEELRRISLSSVANISVWFESPHRISEALGTVAKFKPEADVVAAKELTKVHERIFGGDAGTVAARVDEEIDSVGAKGEWCFAVRFSREKAAESPITGEEAAGGPGWSKALQCLIACQVPVSEAVRQVCQHFGVGKKAAYERALIISGKKVESGY